MARTHNRGTWKLFMHFEGGAKIVCMFEGVVNFFYHHRKFQPPFPRDCWQLPKFTNAITVLMNIHVKKVYFWRKKRYFRHLVQIYITTLKLKSTRCWWLLGLIKIFYILNLLFTCNILFAESSGVINNYRGGVQMNGLR